MECCLAYFSHHSELPQDVQEACKLESCLPGVATMLSSARKHTDHSVAGSTDLYGSLAAQVPARQALLRSSQYLSRPVKSCKHAGTWPGRSVQWPSGCYCPGLNQWGRWLLASNWWSALYSSPVFAVRLPSDTHRRKEDTEAPSSFTPQARLCTQAEGLTLRVGLCKRFPTARG